MQRLWPWLLVAVACAPGAPDERGRLPSAPPPRSTPVEATSDPAPTVAARPQSLPEPAPPDANAVSAALRGRSPRHFGDHIRGIKRRFKPHGDELALTLDVCDGIGPGAIDEELFELVRREKIPAAVFVSGRFAQNHPQFVAALAKEPLFTVENHGFRHRPCSAAGRSMFGIAGTRDVPSMVDEIEENARLLADLTGHRPRFFRPGTAHMDDVCVEAANRLGETPLGYTVAGDLGASLRRSAVKRAIVGSAPGSIILIHAHRPRGDTFEGLRDAVVELRERGARFVALADVELSE